MDTLQLGRAQFALTTSFHFLFVTLTLGLALVVAISETRYVRRGDEHHRRMARFWGQLYVVNYAMGIVTGIVMEFQFGLNWSGLTRVAGGVFGAPLALETLIAFFAESTFLGMWIFGWDRLGKRLHLALIWLVTLTAFLSAYFVLVANGFMQHPAGAVLRGGEVVVTDTLALLSNPFTLTAFGHVLAGALITAGVFLAGISALHLRRRTAERDFFQRSLRTGLVTTAVGVVPSVVLGIVQFQLIGPDQPTKMAAVNGSAEKLTAAQNAMAAQHGPGDYLPPTGAVSGSSDAMMYLWIALTAVAVVGLVLLRRGRVYRARWFQLVLVVALPLPFLANIAGWLFREIGRQPWAVYGLLRTDQAGSGAPASWVAVATIGFAALFLLLAVVDYLLIARLAARGPEPVDLPVRTPELAITF
jgi:cytochrome d ubiquinol oxidase subunit I